MALRLEEREAHRAADQDAVGELEEALDDGDLVGHLGAAEHRDERPRGVGEDARRGRDLALEQEARRRVRDVVGDALGRGVRAVGGAEGVVDVDVGERAERRRELRVVGRSRPARSGRSRAAGSRPARGARRSAWALGPTTSCANATAAPSELAPDAAATGASEGRVGPPLGRPRWLARITLAPRLAQVLDRRQRRADARVVGDRAVLERDVEVDADEHAPAVDLDVVEPLHHAAA